VNATTNPAPTVTIEAIDPSSAHLAKVIELGRAHSGTLGLFPEGAFRDYAARKGIFVALENGACIAYLLFRYSRDRAVIVHLCIDDAHTGKGLARQLVEHLRKSTTHVRGIGLNCRRDYAANNVWPRLGFAAVSDKPGRGKQGKELNYWWLDHGHATLFSESNRQQVEDRLAVVIDHNVFLDLHEKSNNDSLALQADWLRDTVELCVTSENLNEISRHADSTGRRVQRAFATGFLNLESKHDAFTAAYNSLRKHFPATLSEQDESDLRHLARSVAGSATAFATRDAALLDRAGEIYESHRLIVAHPSELIVRVDELQRGSDYQPARLAGTALKIARVTTSQIDAVTKRFQNSRDSETKAKFQAAIRHCLSHPHQIECNAVTDATGALFAVVALDRRTTGVLDLPLFRVSRDAVGSTLAKHIALHALGKAAAEGRTVVRVSDDCPSDIVLNSLRRDRFVATDQGWARPCLATVGQISEMAAQLDALKPAVPKDALRVDAWKDALASGDVGQLLEFERTFWPAKLKGASIPSFIVPIKVHWASQLFDHELANEQLFGGELNLNREAVYYRSARPSCGLVAPSRIFWYVSGDRHTAKSSQIRAVSFLDEVIVGKPKPLFHRFQRLGIYRWQNVFELAGKDIEKPIMALRFSDTVALKQPVQLDALRRILRSCGKGVSLVSPFKIDQCVTDKLLG
jgi:GNAT superfamily N-acetyltransferase/predicted nucleic acid-binding protein